MHLTQIEINGFKSFAKKQQLEFSNGITAIIGPNGCGKSNIADAFRFVLGEQSAKALRGKKVEDFIFGGTEKRRPLSFCEVSLHFDNSDGELLTPFSEVCVTRRAYRSGESEYFINKAACRLKDIHELFRDTGVGKDGYSIIGQGKVSDIISEKSGDRRTAFEEAAGVMKYRARKEEAERKLLNTQKNLIRLDDILSELEGRIEPLREQSEKALSYLKLREELRDIEVNLFIYQYEKSNERIAQLSGAIAQLKSDIGEAELSGGTLAAALAEGEEIERSLTSAINEVSQKLLAASTAAEAQTGEENVLRERIASLIKERERNSSGIAEAEQKIAERQHRAEELSKEAASKAAELAEANAEIESISAGLEKLSAQIDAADDELEGHKRSMMERLNRLSDTRSRASRLDEMKNSLLRRIEAIAVERAAVADEGARLAAEEAECAEAEAALNKKRAGLKAEQDKAVSLVNSINQSIYEARQEERLLSGRLEAAKSRRRVLSEMKRAHEGYYSSVKDLLRDAERDASLGSMIEGVVAELISVPAEYETAVEMALGASLQNVVVPTEQDAKKVIEYLRSRSYGRATLLPVSAMRSRVLTAEERSFINVPGCFGVASELISFSPRYRSIAENLLGRTVIVRDLDVGIEINKRARSSFRIATVKGDIMNPGGSMTGGSVAKREFSLLGRERELEQLEADAKQLAADIAKAGEKTAALEAKLTQANEGVGAFADELRKLDISLAAQSEKRDIVLKYIEKNSQQAERFELELAQINDNIADIDEQTREAEALESGLSTGNESTSEDIKRVQSKLVSLRSKQQEASDSLTSSKVRRMALRKENDAVEAELVRISKEAEDIRTGSEEAAVRNEKALSELEECTKKLDEMSGEAGAERKKVDSLSDELHRLQDERASRLLSVDELRERRENATAELNEMRERTHRFELNLSRTQMELENMAARIWQDYELTYENALPYRRQIAVTASHQRADELRGEIRSLGEVNTASVEDYRNVLERHSQLKAQCDDLKQAELDLTEIIRRLTVTMEREFAEQFKKIQENFGKTFTELFRGGKAELVLSDKNDLLNCDIDIIAQPPGKKLQLLSLLSGGEQALTAIALLFAILKLKPTAFCILDEIDTSLDEANVDNFAEYLKDYSAETQFIIITHRKGAMAVCDSLYGVSMEEKGVSTLISARFDESGAETIPTV